MSPRSRPGCSPELSGQLYQAAHRFLAAQGITGDLVTWQPPLVHPDLRDYLDRIRRVEALRETRALRGFTRVRDIALPLSEGKRLLHRKQLAPAQDWLPAYVVKGEGIYLELEPGRLASWEQRPEVQARAGKITARYGTAPGSVAWKTAP